jgi:hypothetical protein
MVRVFVVESESLKFLKGLFGQQERDPPCADTSQIPRSGNRCRKQLLRGDLDTHRSQA